MLAHLTYSQGALVLSLVFGVTALWFGTRARPKRGATTSYDWRRDAQWRSWM